MRLLVLGDPVEHSLSPVIHDAALRASGLEGDYRRRRVDAGGMADAVVELRHGQLDGANVTMPHKELASALVDRLAPMAGRVGAVNTLVRVAGSVVGHNTDVAGIRSAWAESALPIDAPVLVLGAGGAAAAALAALGDARRLAVAARRSEAAAQLAERLGMQLDVVEWGAGIAGAVVVNATPLGMRGEPLPPPVLNEAVGLFEMAYGAVATPAVAQFRADSRPFVDGTSMLLHQAAISFELWTGHQAPMTAMRQALAAA